MPHSTTYPGAHRARPRRVFFSGTTALVEGQGVCYDRDYGTATSVDGIRDTRVELPTTTNGRNFAGVTAKAYSSNSAGQWIEIYEPGSVCKVAINLATTVNSTTLSCVVGNGGLGRFGHGGFQGRGTALALQTVAAATSAPTAPALVATLVTGTVSTSADGLTLTAASGTPFAYAAANDYVYVLAGCETSGAAATVTPGRYTISSVTSSTVIVLSTACASAASTIACVVTHGNPTCLAYLQDGRESGLTEWIAPVENAASAHMVGGWTNIVGGASVDIDTGDSTATLADGTFVGELKGFKLWGALTAGTSNDHLVSVTTGVQLDGSTALASMEFDGANDTSILEWGGIKWRLIHNYGPTLA